MQKRDGLVQSFFGLPFFSYRGGEMPFRALHALQLLGKDVSLGKKMSMQGGSEGPLVIETTHPGSLVWRSYENIFDMYETIYNALTERLPLLVGN